MSVFDTKATIWRQAVSRIPNRSLTNDTIQHGHARRNIFAGKPNHIQPDRQHISMIIHSCAVRHVRKPHPAKNSVTHTRRLQPSSETDTGNVRQDRPETAKLPWHFGHQPEINMTSLSLPCFSPIHHDTKALSHIFLNAWMLPMWDAHLFGLLLYNFIICVCHTILARIQNVRCFIDRGPVSVLQSVYGSSINLSFPYRPILKILSHTSLQTLTQTNDLIIFIQVRVLLKEGRQTLLKCIKITHIF